jgi:hypothetical protein
MRTGGSRSIWSGIAVAMMLATAACPSSEITADVGQPGGEEACLEGPCECAATNSCGFVCEAGRCGATCPVESTCDLTCADACDLTCDERSSCELRCGNDCIAECASGTNCTIRCQGNCDVTCSAGGTCTVVMKTGSAWCDPTSDCDVRCQPGGPAADAGGGVWMCP